MSGWGEQEWPTGHFNEANARRVAEAEAERDIATARKITRVVFWLGFLVALVVVLVWLPVVWGLVAAYLLIGGLIARLSTPALWRRAVKANTGAHWPGHAPEVNEGQARLDVVGGVVLRWLLWPLAGSYELLARGIDATDPLEREHLIAQQAKRIGELEKELGMEADR